MKLSTSIKFDRSSSLGAAPVTVLEEGERFRSYATAYRSGSRRAFHVQFSTCRHYLLKFMYRYARERLCPLNN